MKNTNHIALKLQIQYDKLWMSFMTIGSQIMHKLNSTNLFTKTISTHGEPKLLTRQQHQKVIIVSVTQNVKCPRLIAFG